MTRALGMIFRDGRCAGTLAAGQSSSEQVHFTLWLLPLCKAQAVCPLPPWSSSPTLFPSFSFIYGLGLRE